MSEIRQRHVLTITGHGRFSERRWARCSCGEFDQVTNAHPDVIADSFAVHVAADIQPSLFQEETR